MQRACCASCEGNASPCASPPAQRPAHTPPAEDELATTLARTVASRGAATLSRKAAPRISKVTVDLTPPEWVWLTWNGTPPEGSDSFMVSTGKGYRDPWDDADACTRDCCAGEDVQCAPPWDKPKKVGACCTPIGTFHTGRTRHNGPWPYWTPVEPLHTAYGRGIALHQHDEVTGEAIGHGCIRMEEENAKRIADYHVPGVTKVVIEGRAKVKCEESMQCGNPDRL